MGEENKQAMNLPAVNLTDGDSTMPMPRPEPGSYFRLTREYDIAAAARAQEIHAKNVERYEHQQKYIKDHPGHVRDSDLKSNPGECPAYIPVAGTVMLVIDQQSSDPPLLRSMNAKKKEIRSTMKTEANPNLAFVPEEEKTKKYNTRVAYAIASFGFMLTGIMTFVIHPVSGTQHPTSSPEAWRYLASSGQLPSSNAPSSKLVKMYRVII